MLKTELQLKLKVSLNLILKNQIEILIYPVQELEQLLKKEKEENPFIEDIVLKGELVKNFEEKKFPEPVYIPGALEELERNVRAEFEKPELDIALELISCIDEKGFFKGDIRSIAETFGVPENYVESIRQRIMRLEPLGVCSKDVVEFVKVQIEDMYPDEPELIDYFERLVKGERIPEHIVKKFSNVRPFPIVDSEISYPVRKVDAIIEEDDGELTGYLYDELVEIKPSKVYLESYAKAKGKSKEYLKNYFERFELLKRIIQLRKENLRKILNIVMEVQKDFLLGKGNLKTLMVKDVAQELNLSESTVSRLINSKYVKTPQGTYPFRFFFVRETAGGISQDELMRMIREIIESEDKTKPLSDMEIAKILKERGYNIARRTVTKYRELLGIPSSRERKLCK